VDIRLFYFLLIPFAFSILCISIYLYLFQCLSLIFVYRLNIKFMIRNYLFPQSNTHAIREVLLRKTFEIRNSHSSFPMPHTLHIYPPLHPSDRLKRSDGFPPSSTSVLTFIPTQTLPRLRILRRAGRFSCHTGLPE